MAQPPIFFTSSMIMILQCRHARHGSRIRRLLDPLARMTGVLIEPVSHEGQRSIMSLALPFVHGTVKYGTGNKRFFGPIRRGLPCSLAGAARQGMHRTSRPVSRAGAPIQLRPHGRPVARPDPPWCIFPSGFLGFKAAWFFTSCQR